MVKGRITKGVGGLYFVDTDDGVFKCNARGIFRKDNVKPAVGDFVFISDIPSLDDVSEKTGIIEEIIPRINMLKRPWVANVQQALIVFSIVSPSINLDLLDRIIVLAEEQGLEVVICLNKADLCPEEEMRKIKELYEKAGYRVIGVSAISGMGIAEIKDVLVGKTSVFAGPSGVGKSSITNCLIPSAQMEVGEISEKISRGKHTTRHAELLQVEHDSYVVDSPGFSNVSFEHIKRNELKRYFNEFGGNDKCKFLDCLHLNEPGCFVKEQVGGEISPVRYDRYVRFLDDTSGGS